MQIHRIESKVDGMGPFRSETLYDGPMHYSAVSDDLQQFWDYANKHLPPPYDEAVQEGKRAELIRIVPHPSVVKFGNASHDSLFKWVPKYVLPTLRRLGFVERIYEVPDEDVLPLPSQIVYRYENARLVSEAPLPA